MAQAREAGLRGALAFPIRAEGECVAVIELFAPEAWLVDALSATGFHGHLDHVFGRAQTVGGIAMLGGTVAGGLIAQVTNLGVPYIIRAAMLGVTLLVALRFMRDIGFSPDRDASPVKAVRNVLKGSIDGGAAQPARALADAGRPVHGGTGIVVHAAQPYLLELFGNPERVQRGGPGGGDLRRGADRRRPAGAVCLDGSSGAGPMPC